MQIVPSLKTGLLSDVAVDIRIVIYRNLPVFLGSGVPQVGARGRVLICVEKSQFVSLFPGDDEVLAIPGPYIVEPDISSAQMDRLGPAAGSQLFVRQTGPSIVLHLSGGVPGWRVFNLTAGTSSSSGETDAQSFSKWKVGVLGTSSVPYWVLSVG